MTGFKARAGRLAPLLLVLMHASGCSTEMAASATKRTLYRCAAGQTFTVARDSRSAVVEYSGVSYVLPKRSSSIAERYASSGAKLIVDGDIAVFVSGSATNLNFCLAAEPRGPS